MKIALKLTCLLLIVCMLLPLTACGGDKENVIELNVYNWGEYISDGSEDSFDTNKEFEKYFNTTLSAKYNGAKVKVNYSTYPTNEDMYAKMKNSAASYDIVIPSDYMIQRLIEEKMLLSFDVEKDIPNYEYIPESFRSPYFDSDNTYSVPYTYGMLGIIYNKTMVDPEDIDEEEERSWALMWNPKYAGNILQFNNPRDAFATAMYWKGLDINATEPEPWNEALELLKQQKPLLQGYVSDEIFDKMRGESAAIAPYFVGDFLTMADEQENLDFFYPREGVNYFVDSMCIPVTSKHPEIAKEYINFMLMPEVAMANAMYIGYACPHTYVVENEEYITYMEEEFAYRGANGETAYDLLYDRDPDEVNKIYNSHFPPETKSPACYRSFTSEIQELTNELWEDLKISSSIEPWVHVTSIAIVVGVVGFAAYSIYIKKKRSRFYRERDKAKSKK